MKRVINTLLFVPLGRIEVERSMGLEPWIR